MAVKNVVSGKLLTGERALFNSHNLIIEDCIFDEGESPLKECQNISLKNSMFRWKYPLWYCNDIQVDNCTWYEMGRAGVWYSQNLVVKDSMIDAPKNFRRCENLEFTNVSFSNASETLWHCKDVKLNNVVAKGDYFAMNSENIVVDGLNLCGNYSFDGAKNIEIRNSKLISKDAFWNAENVVVYDSQIYGEYLAWNAKNITFINCTIESLQGLCYIENLKMVNCKTLNTNLAFEYSSVDVEIKGNIDSVKNPKSGKIIADSIGEIIMENDKVDTSKTSIEVKESN